jgi:hypothetical protein
MLSPASAAGLVAAVAVEAALLTVEEGPWGLGCCKSFRKGVITASMFVARETVLLLLLLSRKDADADVEQGKTNHTYRVGHCQRCVLGYKTT